MQVKQTITVSVPVTQTVKGPDGTESQVTTTVQQQQEVTVDVPDDPNLTKDQFVGKEMEQYKGLSQDKQVQEKAQLEQIYDHAHKGADGKVDMSGFNDLVAGLAQHQGTEHAMAAIDGTKIADPSDNVNPLHQKADKDSAEKQLTGAEAALANIPQDDPKRADYEAKVKQLQGDFKSKYGDRTAPVDDPKATGQAPADKTHEVQSGDTLNRIAAQNGVSIEDLKKANPEIFQNGKDSSGRRRTAGGDLIYPGDPIKIPGKGKPADLPDVANAKKAIDGASISPNHATGGSPDAQDAQRAADQKTLDAAHKALAQIPPGNPQHADYQAKVKQLEANFGHKSMTDAAGQRATTAEQTINQITANKPAPGSAVNDDQKRNEVQANYQRLATALAEIPPDAPGYEGFKKAVDDYKAAAQAAINPAPSGTGGPAPAQGSTGAKPTDPTEADVQAAQKAVQDKACQLAGHQVDVSFNNPGMSPKDKFAQLQALDKQLSDPANAAIFKDLNQIQITDDKGSKAKLDGKILQVSTHGDNKALADMAGNAKVEGDRQAVETMMAQQTGHPVSIKFSDSLDPKTKEQELGTIMSMLMDPRYKDMLGQFDKIEFHTVRGASDDTAHADNLHGYVQKDGKTLKINKPDNDGLTALEFDKQLRALAQLRDTGHAS
jgi:LysM repeat protein